VSGYLTLLTLAARSSHYCFGCPTYCPSFVFSFFVSLLRRQQKSTLFPYTTLFRSRERSSVAIATLKPSFTSPSTFSRGTRTPSRSEEHTSELQSPYDLVCRLLLEKKKTDKHRA